MEKYRKHSPKQQRNNLVILVQLDGCRFDYIEEAKTQLLFDLKRQGVYGSLIPTFGFEPDAAYTAGLYPDESNGGAQFWYDPGKSPFSFLGQWAYVLNLLPDLPERALRRLIKRIAGQRCLSPTLSTARIPFHLLKYFGFPMHCRIDEPTFDGPDSSIFDILRKANRVWLYHGFPNYKVNMDSVVSRVEKSLFPPFEFAFFHIGDLDKIGHRYGPEAEEIKAGLKKIDKGIKRIIEIANERFTEVHLVVIGDHGMIAVRRHLDIWSKLKKLPLCLEKDYLMFLDSTMARFWFFSDRAEKLIVDMLENIKGGHTLNQAEKDRYHLNYSHDKFGDIIFLADPGVLISPNFYQNRKPVKGMHGYAPETPEQQSALVIHSSKVKQPKKLVEPVDMRSIFPTILNLLALPMPEGCKLQSLIE